MAKIDLKPLSLAELNALKKRVDKAIERHDKQRKTKALAALKAKAKELGFSLGDLTSAGTSKPKAAISKRKKPAKVTHRHPHDATKTWVGRGPRPQWLRDELAQGKDVADFKV
ncbi:H-NS histone family protein [uncultured Litoreibacter sp.]|uniref:H-NS histone family protein n=1 Tax=uncultured Litoreibacter sp. TaxID=1392394 RepID=UPI00260442CA|nr:H-NS histone family protein [uncultured Litoreibacter sp.]